MHRKSLGSQVWANADLWRLWCYCLLRANHKDDWVAVGGVTEPVHVKRGQFVTGRFSLHKALFPKKKKIGKSPLTVWRWLKNLQSMGNLNIKTNNKYSIVTIHKYTTYQDVVGKNEQVIEQQVNNRRTTDEQQVNTNKNVKNNKNDKKTTKGVKIDFPSNLQTKDFQSAWAEWEQHRKEKRQKLTPSTIKSQIKMLSKNPDQAIGIIKQSIGNGWTGLFSVKGEKSGNSGQTQRNFAEQTSQFGETIE